MLKASIASVLALAAAVSVSGCNGKPQEAAKTDAAPTAAAPAGPTAMPADHPQARPTGEVDLDRHRQGRRRQDRPRGVHGEGRAREPEGRVRGKVVKTNAGIMDKDWVHVRDGSGEDGKNDLTVTTTSTAAAEGRRHGASSPARSSSTRTSAWVTSTPCCSKTPR